MKQPVVAALYVLLGGALFWAYTIISTLIREFGGQVTVLDLAVLVVLGFIAGLALGLVIAFRRRERTSS